MPRHSASGSCSASCSPKARASGRSSSCGTCVFYGGAEPMLAFGAQLGRLIYMMDAAIDYAEDAGSGSYNPFVGLGSTPAAMQTALAVMADGTAAAFEKLPLEQDLHLLRSIIYAGVWQKFNHTYRDADLPFAPVIRSKIV